MRSLFSYKKALPQSRQGRSTETKNQANLLVGLYHTSAIKINSTVNNKLIGYTSMIVWKVRLQGKTRYTYAHHGQATRFTRRTSRRLSTMRSKSSVTASKIDRVEDVYCLKFVVPWACLGICRP